MVDTDAARTGISTFTLGNAQHPFYTISITTNISNKPISLSISRTNPSNPQINIPIMSLALEDHHPNDNLITHLFSHLAAMLAIEQSAELAAQHNLSQADALEAEGKALRRAVEMESCELVWVRERAGYELHPSSMQQQQRGHGHGQAALVGAAGISLSPAPAPSPSPSPSPTQLKSKNPGPLHITVSTPSPPTDTNTYTEEEHEQPPTIIATTPIPQNTTSTPNLTATPRTSTLPHTDSPAHDALATLDLGTMTLGISTEAVVRAVPGWLYAVDSVVAAVLAVGFVDGRVGGVLLGMDVGGGCTSGEQEREREVDQENNPTSPNHDHGTNTSTTKPSPKDTIQTYTTTTINTIKTTLSTIYTWVRSLPTKIPPTLSLKLHLPTHNSTANANNTTTTNPNKSKRNNPNPKTKKFLREEFDLDLEHYGGDSFQEGGQLPTATRGILKALFWGFEVAVCGMVMLVTGVVWLVLRVSGWVCSVAGVVRRWWVKE